VSPVRFIQPVLVAFMRALDIDAVVAPGTMEVSSLENMAEVCRVWRERFLHELGSRRCGRWGCPFDGLEKIGA
jgi:hypothetical protein